jgi:hypothetical protein
MDGRPAAQDGVANLVGKAFFAYYEPRLRDNERALQVQPLRGGLRASWEREVGAASAA